MLLRLKYFLLFAGLLTSSISGFSQIHIDWNTLADVSFEKKYEESMGLAYDEATFGSIIKMFEGKEVKIAGYIIPLDAMGLSFVLSRNPNANCFFCGGGGPETIIDIKLKPSAIARYRMDERKTFKGVLKLHPDNTNSFIYVLHQAEPI